MATPKGLRLEPLAFDKIISGKIIALAESARGLKTSQYLAYKDAEEVGFLSVDRLPGHLEICAIFVLKEHRGNGFGTALLVKAEKVALEGNLSCVKLNADPMDEEICPSELVRWYIKRGYCLNPDIENDMYKNLDGTLQSETKNEH